MVTKTGNINLYDNFKMGIVKVPDEPGGDKFVHVAFTEQDFEQDELNPAHVFKIHEKQVDDFIAMIREAQGKRSLHIPKPGESPSG